MKKLLFLFLVMTCFSLAQAQVNKLKDRTEIDGPNQVGWYEDWCDGTVKLSMEGSILKVANQTGTGTLKGGICHRFTPSHIGQYVVKFKAKASVNGQKMKSHLFQGESWKNLTKVAVMDEDIPTGEFGDFEFLYEYEEINDRTPATAILKFVVDGVLGDIWIDDVRVYDLNDNHTIYFDSFDTDMYYGLYAEKANSWEHTEFADPKKFTLGIVDHEFNKCLEIANGGGTVDPWGATMSRHFWGDKGTQYRISFDLQGSVAMAGSDAFNAFDLEVWPSGSGIEEVEKIIPTKPIQVPTVSRSHTFLTKPVVNSRIMKMSLYAGRIPTDQKVWVDNVMIVPMYLYNVTVDDPKDNSLIVSWKNSGYMTTDLMDIYLVNNDVELQIASDVPAVPGMKEITLLDKLINGQTYTIRVKDKVDGLRLSAETQFVYNPVGLEDATLNAPVVYVRNNTLFVSGEADAIQVMTTDGKYVAGIADIQDAEITLGSGIYLVRVVTKGSVCCHKIVIY